MKALRKRQQLGSVEAYACACIAAQTCSCNCICYCNCGPGQTQLMYSVWELHFLLNGQMVSHDFGIIEIGLPRKKTPGYLKDLQL